MRSFRDVLLTGTQSTNSLPKSKEDLLWRDFCEGGTTHSAAGVLVSQMILRAEREGVPYRLEAVPGVGYKLERLELL